MKLSLRESINSKSFASLDHRLDLYSLAAGAASVSLLALAQPAEATIVYRSADKHIAPNTTVPLDLNNDGKIDFRIHDSFTCTSFCEYIVGAITVIPSEAANEVVGFTQSGYNFASALPAGAVIGPKARFAPGKRLMEKGGYDAGTTTVGYCEGPWKDQQRHYLGLKFTIRGRIHYGWARLNETCAKNGENTAQLTGYAYETVPNKPIIAGKTEGAEVSHVREANPAMVKGQTASLDLLAMGAPGLSIWRREESAPENN